MGSEVIMNSTVWKKTIYAKLNNLFQDFYPSSLSSGVAFFVWI